MKEKDKYFVRSVQFGVGYQIIKRKEFISCYETPDKEQAKQVCGIFNNSSDYTEEELMDQIPKPSDKWPIKILCFKEKHGDIYFIVRTNKDIEKIALDVVLTRNEQDWYRKPELEEFKFDELLSDNTINALPTENLRIQAKKDMVNLTSKINSQKREIQDWNTLQEIIINKNEKLALSFLKWGQDGEYENFELINPSNTVF